MIDVGADSDGDIDADADANANANVINADDEGSMHPYPRQKHGRYARYPV